MISAELSPLVTESVLGVSVINICDLLDRLYSDQDRWMEQSFEDRCGRIINWLNVNQAHYHAWEGPSYLRLAEKDKAVCEALRLGKSIVVIESLS